MALKIDYELTGTGWARCTVRPARRNFSFSVSYDSDALKCLVVAAIAMLGDTDRIAFYFAGRSSWWYWNIDQNSPTELTINISEITPEVQLHKSETDEVTLSMEDSVKLVVEFKCKALSFAQVVHVAAANVKATHGLKGYKELWASHDFPSHELQLLAKSIAASETQAQQHPQTDPTEPRQNRSKHDGAAIKRFSQ
ncbi:MAG: hypothetical protein IPN53_05385 [Comamonadaceae bacterium]|nr:hypothetical protein [Comamonadaceae bacterium]